MIKAAWHRAHVIARNTTLDERIAWHEEHARGCRPIPDKLKAKIEKRRQEKQ